MTRKLTEFSQKKLAQKKGLKAGGFCLALASRWVKLIVQCKKDKWDVPQQDVDTRLKDLTDNAEALHALHQKYLARQQKVMDMVHMQEALVLVGKSGYMEMEDRGSLIQYLGENDGEMAAFSLVDVGGIHLQKSALLLMKKLKVTAKSVRSVTVTDAEVAETIASEKIQKNAAYVVTPVHGTTSSEHALAVFRTSGVFSTYFYIFDPNYGEVYASSQEDAAFVINKFMGAECPYKTTQWNLLRCE